MSIRTIKIHSPKSSSRPSNSSNSNSLSETTTPSDLVNSNSNMSNLSLSDPLNSNLIDVKKVSLRKIASPINMKSDSKLSKNNKEPVNLFYPPSESMPLVKPTHKTSSNNDTPIKPPPTRSSIPKSSSPSSSPSKSRNQESFYIPPLTYLPIHDILPKPSPQSTNSFEFFTQASSSPSTPLSDQTIEESLLNKSFIPTDRILIQTKEGPFVQYLKVITDRGHTALIELDIDGDIAVSSKNIILHGVLPTQPTHINIIPYSIKAGTFECAGNDVCGIAFECHGEICTLTRTDDLKPKEATFTIQKLNTASIGTLSNISGILPNDYIRSYPIVRMSEILVNPQLLTENIDLVTKRIQRANYLKCSQEANIMLDNYNNMTDKLIEMGNTINSNLNLLRDTIDELEEYRKNFETIKTKPCEIREEGKGEGESKEEDPKSEEQSQELEDIKALNKEKYRKIIFNLRRRYDMLSDLIKICRDVNLFRDDINKLSDKFDKITQFINEGYKGLDKVYE